ncbi:RimK/LysX family protein [Bacteriovoracaceae bacterium]|nr:RimK/LysX family protein [Bacteriovoracaceae bacterium]
MERIFRFTLYIFLMVFFTEKTYATKLIPSKTNLESIASKQCCLGWREWVKLPEFFNERLMVKVDSGAKTSSLHAENLHYFEKENEEWVKFDVYPKRSSKKTKYTIEAKIIETKNIRSSNGKMSIRPVIKTPISIGGIEWNIEINLVDRSMMGYRMLLGRTAFEKKFLIDSGKSFIFSGKLKKESKTAPTHLKSNYYKNLLKIINVKDDSISGNSLKSFLVLFLLFIIRIYSNLILNKKEFRSDLEKLRTKTLIKRALLLIGFTFLLFIWINEFRAISIYLMAMSVAVVLTMREAIKSFHGGMHLLSSRPFKMGDFIQIKNHIGEVVQTDFMSTKILENSSLGDANLITLPNSLFLSTPIINKTTSAKMKTSEQKVNFIYTFKEDKNWKKKEDIFRVVIASLYNNEPDFIYSLLPPDKIQLSIKFKIMNKNVEEVKSKILREFLQKYYGE